MGFAIKNDERKGLRTLIREKMTIQYKCLTEDDFPQAHATMVEAFSDYHLDMSYMTSDRS